MKSNFTQQKQLLFCLTILCMTYAGAQPFPPGAGQPGSTAIHRDSAIFINWAASCKVFRGYQDISNPGAGLATAGDSTSAFGKADGLVVSLGDGGSATFRFEVPVSNGAGYDFAVFENSFDGSFLELAFVEVSSDGINFFRFPASSLTDTNIQTASFGNTLPENINNLAGKYQAAYGTPFDLEELMGTQGLNTGAVTHIRITDVVGSIESQYASRDHQGRKVNDPWPTAFPSCGFDLDALGVIHQNVVSGIDKWSSKSEPGTFINPVVRGTVINPESSDRKFELCDYKGCKLLKGYLPLDTSVLECGLYFLKIESDSGTLLRKLIVF